MSDDFNERYRTWHARISYLKSAVRLACCGLALLLHSEPTSAVIALGVGLGLAEVLGILEEWI